MIFSEHLYYSDNLLLEKEAYKSKAFRRWHRDGLYLILLGSSADESLKMVPAIQLKEEDKEYVLGIARGYFHGLLLMKHMMEDCLNRSGSVDFLSYFGREFGL